MKITRKPPRFHQDNSCYFLTCCTYQHRPILHQNDVPEILLHSLAFYIKHLEELLAYTIMPDHIHLLANVRIVPELSIFLRDFKKWTTREIKNMLDLDCKYVWQRGTMDHCIRVSNNDFQQHLQYIFSNSWKHLGVPPKDFIYHNFSEIVSKGWLDDDFFDTNNEDLTRFYEYKE